MTKAEIKKHIVNFIAPNTSIFDIDRIVNYIIEREKELLKEKE